MKNQDEPTLNWDAAELERRVSEGVLVSFVDTRQQDAPKIAEK
jgi:hypothetical protein